MQAARPELDLTATVHLGVRGVVTPTPDVLRSEILDSLSDEERSAVAALDGSEALLIIQKGAGKGSRFLLTATGASAGRAPENTIFLDDVTVSRKHANVVSSVPGIFRIQDIGSLNGTYLNHVSVSEEVLKLGDEIQIGKFHMTFIGGSL